MDYTPLPPMSRTCPWCGNVRVAASSHDGLVHELVTHLATCSGEDTGEQPQ